MKGTIGGLLIFLTVLVLVGCEKNITVDLPTAPTKIVVQGSIEPGQPPIVILSYSQGYFDPADFEALTNSYVHDAFVRVSNGADTVTLDQFCSQDLTPEMLDLASQILGIPGPVIQALNICIYTTLNPAMFGETGKIYKLWVDKDDHHLSSVTKLNYPVLIDSLWFAPPSGNPADSLGFIYGSMTDPDSLGNAYRWFAKRISHYPYSLPDSLAEYRGMIKDYGFVTPLPSVFDDSFFNGLTFEFAYYRGAAAFSSKFDDNNSEAGYYKRGDTVVVRGSSIDRNAFLYFKSYENQLSNQGSPFALPSNIQSNVTGGLGVWVGYSAIYDTLVCQ